ncbi:MAG: DNA topology modulation protein FlaR [Pseudomonadota bacterium]
MKRVMIVGGPGSGKSTLALKLGEITGLPIHHMDHIHWKAGWVERPRPEKIAMSLEIHAKDRWILEGGLSATYDDRVARCDTLIWLDVPMWLRLFRVLRRTLRYLGQTRPDLPDGCPEQFSGETVEFIRFIIRTRRTARNRILRLRAEAPARVTQVRLTTIPSVERYLATLSEELGGGAAER